jgi:Na+/melibiose symporter-like transporter
MDWRQPATSDDFEHDVSASPTSAFVLLILIIVLGIVLVASIPEDVVAPWSAKMLWLGLLILLAILFFPARWALRRPWTVVAETGDNGEGTPTEKWTGTVRGVLAMRQEVTRASKSIRQESHPGIEGLLQPVA